MAFTSTNMKISTETEMMKNQKHAEVMSPDKAFEALQTSQGDALFFSIGTDGVFYVTRETRGSQTGWNRIDLSVALGGKAKSFVASQDPATMNIDVALIMTTTSGDTLFLSRGNTTDTNTWEQIVWILIDFDATPALSVLSMADVYFISLSSADSTTRCCFVDIEQDPNNPTHALTRYYIQLESSPNWVRHALPIALKAGSISSCLGRRRGDNVPGIYTFGAIDSTQELIYSPQYNEFDPRVAPRPARLNLPAGAGCVASSFNAKGESSLFVAASDGLWLFSSDNQHDGAKPSLVLPSPVIGKYKVFASLTALSAALTATRTAVWGINTQGDLVYAWCAAGKETDSSAWSLPVPICPKVEGYAFYLNNDASNNVVFAHTSGDVLIQLTQDPITSLWSQRQILLPATDANDVIEYNTYTTHIKVSNDYGVGVADTPMAITSTSPVAVFIDGIYHVLTSTVPLQIATDALGTVTVVQETQSLSAVAYTLKFDNSLGTVNVDPLSKPMERLAAIQSGDDLSKVKITAASGEKPLVPDDVSSDAKNSAAKCFKNLVQVKDSMQHQTNLNGVNRSASLLPQSFGMSFATGAFHEGEDAHSLFGVQRIALSADNFIEVAAGDLFNMVKNWFDEVESFVVQKAGEVWQFCAKIYDNIYNAVLDSVAAVVGAIEFVFNQIKIFIEEVIAWLGFLFNWNDILRTHKVIKNVLKQFGRKAISEIDSIEKSVQNALASAEVQIDSWAGITGHGQAVPLQAPNTAGADTPQANWAMSHVKNGLGVSAPNQVMLKAASNNSALDQALEALENPFAQGLDVFEDAISRLQHLVIDEYTNLSLDAIIKRIAAILSDAMLKETSNLVTAALDVVKVVATKLLDKIDESIDIPVLSWLYKLITGEDLSILDVVCLVGAIPCTLIYKIATNSTPFPANNHTQEIIDAQDFGTIQRLLSTQTLHSSKVAVKDAVGTSQQDATIIAFDYVGFAGSIISVWMTYKDLKAEGNLDTRDRYIAWCGSLLYLSPSIVSGFAQSGRWDFDMNDTISTIYLLKTGLDALLGGGDHPNWEKKYSPMIESVLNAVWLIPAVAGAAYGINKASDGTGFVASLFFDFGGILVWPYRKSEVLDPKMAGGIMACTGICGAMDFATASALLDGN
jgi:hypothetical protein